MDISSLLIRLFIGLEKTWQIVRRVMLHCANKNKDQTGRLNNFFFLPNFCMIHACKYISHPSL